jgi:pimeloyl-ACP methyl ester carboxylesterase
MKLNRLNRLTARRAVALASITAAVAAAALVSAFPTSADTATSANTQRSEATKPTVVLIHGAFADSSSWNGVIQDLKRKRYPVIAPANPLRGLHSDAQYLRSVLDSVDGPIVLAGHSYGGSVMSEAADGHPDVKALVYIASFQPEVGESTAELAAKFPGGELGPTLNPVSFPTADGGTGTDLYIQQDKFRQVFAADVPRKVAELMAVTQRPIAANALEEKATKTAWKTIESWTMVTTKDLAIPADSMRFMAERANSHTIEIDASHAVTVSKPGAVTDLIHKAARATTP